MTGSAPLRSIPIAIASLAIAALPGGCSSAGSYFPCDLGLVWTYSVRTGFGAEHVEEIRVARRLTVASAEGVELEGPLASSRLAWKGSTLWLESLANARFVPAAPILDTESRPMRWKGQVMTAFGSEPAKGQLSQRAEKLTVEGRPFEAMRTELAIDRPLGQTVLTTWFARGVGIVRQEQRTRGVMDLRLEWIAGPKSGPSKR